MHYSVFLTKVNIGVFSTVQIASNPTLKFLPILVVNITFSSTSLPELAL